MGEQRDNSGAVWATKNFNDDNAKCHFSGDALVGGVGFKLFGRRSGDLRLIDFTVDGANVAKCELERRQKSKSDKAPHYIGKVVLDDVEYEVAGWAKLVNTKWGEKRMLSLEFKRLRESEPATDTVSEYDEEMPF